VVPARFPEFEEVYRTAGFRMFDDIDRVYVSAKAQGELGWRPRHDFGSVLGQVARGERIGSALAAAIGIKGYHAAPR
jgi:UDP-glucose 4-epimerase